MKVTSANKYYLSEFSYDDGEYEITFNIVDISFVHETITCPLKRKKHYCAIWQVWGTLR